MPTISAFYGIVIQRFWSEHGVPHFHALYAEHEAVIDIRELRVLRGALPRRALTLRRIGTYAESISRPGRSLR